jgi:NADPH:quinone reductase-like Zn-dependent oxidoreductase
VGETRDVWRIGRAGSLNRLRQQSEALPDPAPGEARVAVRAVGLNFADVFACLGLYSATPTGPFVPGLEFAGVVEGLGPAPTGFPPNRLALGDRVLGLTRFGAYASALNVDVRSLRPLPAAWSFEEGAAYPAQALTAWYGLTTLGALAPGHVLLVHSAAGGVGLHALAIAAARQAVVVATIGHPSKRDTLLARGLMPPQVIVRHRRTFAGDLDRALAALGARGFDVVFDAVAGPYFRPAWARLRPEGRYVAYGAADFMSRGARPNYLRLGWQYLRRPRLDPLQMMSENRSLMAFNLIWLWDQVDRLSAFFEEMAPVLERPPLVPHRFPFAEAPDALRLLQQGRTTGKVVLVLDQGRQG